MDQKNFAGYVGACKRLGKDPISRSSNSPYSTPTNTETYLAAQAASKRKVPSGILSKKQLANQHSLRISKWKNSLRSTKTISMSLSSYTISLFLDTVHEFSPVRVELSLHNLTLCNRLELESGPLRAKSHTTPQ